MSDMVRSRKFLSHSASQCGQIEHLDLLRFSKKCQSCALIRRRIIRCHNIIHNFDTNLVIHLTTRADCVMVSRIDNPERAGLLRSAHENALIVGLPLSGDTRGLPPLYHASMHRTNSKAQMALKR